jgi:hypothetical protein
MPERLLTVASFAGLDRLCRADVSTRYISTIERRDGGDKGARSERRHIVNSAVSSA